MNPGGKKDGWPAHGSDVQKMEMSIKLTNEEELSGLDRKENQAEADSKQNSQRTSQRAATCGNVQWVLSFAALL